MKLREIIERVRRSEKNQTSVDPDLFLRELEQTHLSVDWSKFQERMTCYFFQVWYCTDTFVASHDKCVLILETNLKERSFFTPMFKVHQEIVSAGTNLLTAQQLDHFHQLIVRYFHKKYLSHYSPPTFQSPIEPIYWKDMRTTNIHFTNRKVSECTEDCLHPFLRNQVISLTVW